MNQSSLTSKPSPLVKGDDGRHRVNPSRIALTPLFGASTHQGKHYASLAAKEDGYEMVAR